MNLKTIMKTWKDTKKGNISYAKSLQLTISHIIPNVIFIENIIVNSNKCIEVKTLPNR